MEKKTADRIKQRINDIALEKSSSPSDWGWIEQYMIEGYKIAQEEYASQSAPKEGEDIDELKKEAMRFAQSQPDTIPPRMDALALGYFWGTQRIFKTQSGKEGYILPTEEEAGIYAVKISEEQGLSAQEQSFVIAGFTECIKWLNWLKLTTPNK